MIRIPQDTLMGVAIALASLMLLVREQWFLTHTQKGQKLVNWFGAASAVWVLRGILTAAMVFGGLLAGGIIRPIQWGPYSRKRQWRESDAIACRAASATPSSASISAI